jgi:hypothetical protein
MGVVPILAPLQPAEQNPQLADLDRSRIAAERAFGADVEAFALKFVQGSNRAGHGLRMRTNCEHEGKGDARRRAILSAGQAFREERLRAL